MTVGLMICDNVVFFNHPGIHATLPSSFPIFFLPFRLLLPLPLPPPTSVPPRSILPLSLQEEVLRKIESENPGNENKQKRALFKWWLDQNTRATWSDLLMALTRVDSSLGDYVRDIYGIKGKVGFTCINTIHKHHQIQDPCAQLYYAIVTCHAPLCRMTPLFSCPKLCIQSSPKFFSLKRGSHNF